MVIFLYATAFSLHLRPGLLQVHQAFVASMTVKSSDYNLNGPLTQFLQVTVHSLLIFRPYKQQFVFP